MKFSVLLRLSLIGCVSLASTLIANEQQTFVHPQTREVIPKPDKTSSLADWKRYHDFQNAIAKTSGRIDRASGIHKGNRGLQPRHDDAVVVINDVVGVLDAARTQGSALDIAFGHQRAMLTEPEDDPAHPVRISLGIIEIGGGPSVDGSSGIRIDRLSAGAF